MTASHSTHRFGLIGEKLGHSLSPQIHALLGEYDYQLYPLAREALQAFVCEGPLSGFNVTIPYKQTVMPWCDELTERARAIGAVNTIVRTKEGKLLGDNTDYAGFLYQCERSGMNFASKHCAVLGSGGASKTVVAVLTDLGAMVQVVSREGNYTYADLVRDAPTYEAIINTTPVGMFPNLDASPLSSLDAFTSLEAVLDLIYNPLETRLLQMAKKRALIAQGGLSMLVMQAIRASERFQGKTLPADLTQRVLSTLEGRTQNVILVGMPGSGKSTLGKKLAQALNRPFYDLDEVIREESGRSPAQWIEEEGEAYFRDIETQLLAKLTAQHGNVIATGGGSVIRERNRDLMHQNGRVVWLQRELDKLSTHGRPLSQTKGVAQLYAEREPLYRAVSDLTIQVDRHPEASLARLLAALDLPEGTL